MVLLIEAAMDEPIQIPMIDLALPAGWKVKHTRKEWQALSTSGKMQISIIHDGENYRSILRRTADKVNIIEVQAESLEYVIPAIERFVSLVLLSETPDIMSSPPDTLKS
jgi:hypothetical protein